jgi:repressor LexA
MGTLNQKSDLGQASSLTKRQRDLLEYVTHSVHAEHRMPSYRDMAKAMGVSAVGTIQDLVSQLLEKGFLEKDGRLLKIPGHRSSATLMLPILGEVAAGSLTDAFEVSLGTLPVSPALLGLRGEGVADDLFALRVKGDSMIDAGIFEKDLVVVKKRSRPKNGDFIVARVGNEATVKEYRNNPARDYIELIPHNKRLSPIKVAKDEESFEVLGKVVAVHRVLE